MSAMKLRAHGFHLFVRGCYLVTLLLGNVKQRSVLNNVTYSFGTTMMRELSGIRVIFDWITVVGNHSGTSRRCHRQVT